MTKPQLATAGGRQREARGRGDERRRWRRPTHRLPACGALPLLPPRSLRSTHPTSSLHSTQQPSQHLPGPHTCVVAIPVGWFHMLLRRAPSGTACFAAIRSTAACARRRWWRRGMSDQGRAAAVRERPAMCDQGPCGAAGKEGRAGRGRAQAAGPGCLQALRRALQALPVCQACPMARPPAAGSLGGLQESRRSELGSALRRPSWCADLGLSLVLAGGGGTPALRESLCVGCWETAAGASPMPFAGFAAIQLQCNCVPWLPGACGGGRRPRSSPPARSFFSSLPGRSRNPWRSSQLLSDTASTQRLPGGSAGTQKPAGTATPAASPHDGGAPRAAAPDAPAGPQGRRSPRAALLDGAGGAGHRSR